MARTPQQRTDEDREEGLAATPDAPQGRTDGAQDAEESGPTDTDESAGLKTPVTREEIERRQLDDDVE